MTAESNMETPNNSKAPSMEHIMLGFFDVLGFSKRVETEGPEQIAALYHRLIETTVKKMPKTCMGSVSNGDGTRSFTVFSLDVQYAYFSDTIIMWVPLQLAYAEVFVTHCTTFFCEALALDLPIRGAISLGEAVMHRETGTYIGMPIVEGASCESIQEWVGVSMTESATWPPFFAEVHPNLYIEYDIPVKLGSESILPPVALDWTRRWEELYGYPAVQKIQELDNKAPHKKLKNTLAFAQFCIDNKDWHKRPPEAFLGKRIKRASMSVIPPKSSNAQK